jgi:hypothetical protein
MKKSFFFHYNKLASQSRGKPTISVHFNNKCHLVDNVVCQVSTTGRIRKTSPKFVMSGKCSKFTVDNNIAIIS